MSTFLGLSYEKIVVFSEKFRKNRKLGFSTKNVKIRNLVPKTWAQINPYFMIGEDIFES